MKVVIPIAGRGSRFQSAADKNSQYSKPKPLIEIKGKPMVVWALESLPFIELPHRSARGPITVMPDDIVFIALVEHEKQYQITQKIKQVAGDGIHVELIPEVTRGALETALYAKKYLTDDDMILSDCDHYFDGSALYDGIMKKDAETDGIIPVFKPADAEPKWSYTLFDDKQVARAVGEKDPELAAQGAYANIGAYYFTRGTTFVSEAEEMIKQNEMHGPSDKQEFYVAPLYQRMIKKNMKIMTAIIPQVWGLGTPSDLELFLKEFKS